LMKAHEVEPDIKAGQYYESLDRRNKRTIRIVRRYNADCWLVENIETKRRTVISKYTLWDHGDRGYCLVANNTKSFEGGKYNDVSD
jgi:hypothetical protein